VIGLGWEDEELKFGGQKHLQSLNAQIYPHDFFAGVFELRILLLPWLKIKYPNRDKNTNKKLVTFRNQLIFLFQQMGKILND